MVDLSTSFFLHVFRRPGRNWILYLEGMVEIDPMEKRAWIETYDIPRMLPGLVNIQKTIENHPCYQYFQWLNQLFLWAMASSSQTVNVYRRPGRSLKILQNSDAKNRKTAAQLRPRRLHDGNNLKKKHIWC